MSGKGNSILTVIENGQICSYILDDKVSWNVGRPAKDNNPDIKLHSATVSRKHGKFQNMDGVWFYLDGNGKNGTVYNNKHISAGINGRIKPIMLNDGDVFIFGGGEEAVINYKTIWAMFEANGRDERWRVVDTKGMSSLSFSCGDDIVKYECPAKGTVVKNNNGTAIYMGDLTYLSGDMSIIGK